MKSLISSVFVVTLFVCLSVKHGLSLQYQLISTSDSCQQKLTCQECISDASVCVWCAENDVNLTTRCMPQTSVENSWCPKSRQNPENEAEDIDTQPFSSVSEHVIQIKPQRYKLKLRQGMPKSLNFSFQGSPDYPVDLYFLLDASKTMDSIKNMTASKGKNIYNAIKKMTNNVHLGFGTFIDKRILPIMRNTNDELIYTFRHRLKLVDDFKQFQEEVSKTASGNKRDPQAGVLDALAQVLACKDIIGWRNESRKIVVLLTDGPYHAAGDGKSAGLFEPYDGQCYTKNGTYTKELEMDYPSVAMINKLATERDIIVLFLVDPPQLETYRRLKSMVGGSQVAILSRNPENNDTIDHILKNIYENILSKIKLVARIRSGNKKHFKISFEPDCTADVNNPACDVEIGKEQHFVGTVQYDAAESAVIDISVEGTGEKLTLDIDSIKKCDCERNPEIQSAFCFGDKRVCGICSCSENRTGQYCDKSTKPSLNCDERRGDINLCSLNPRNDADCFFNGYCGPCETCICYTNRDGSQYFDQQNNCAGLCSVASVCEDCLVNNTFGKCTKCHHLMTMQRYNESRTTERDAQNRTVWVKCSENIDDCGRLEFYAKRDEYDEYEIFVMMLNHCNETSAAAY